MVQLTRSQQDGKTFGTRIWDIDIKKFTGTKKINALEAYPIKYHDNAAELQQSLVERGKKFVSLRGMHHKFHQGMGFMQKPRHFEKTSINSRVMIDRATFRRINPNYPFAYVKAADVNLHSTEYVSEDDSEDSEGEKSSDSEGACDACGTKPKKLKNKRVYKFVRNRLTGEWKTISFLVEDPGEGNLIDPGMEPIEGRCNFSEEELLLAPPVVYGFAFQEKLWCEFSIDGITDIEWTAGAFDSLVVPDDRKVCF